MIIRCEKSLLHGGWKKDDVVLIMQSLANPSKYGIDGSDDHHITEEGYLLADVDATELPTTMRSQYRDLYSDLKLSHDNGLSI